MKKEWLTIGLLLKCSFVEKYGVRSLRFKSSIIILSRVISKISLFLFCKWFFFVLFQPWYNIIHYFIYILIILIDIKSMGTFLESVCDRKGLWEFFFFHFILQQYLALSKKTNYLKIQFRILNQKLGEMFSL